MQKYFTQQTTLNIFIFSLKQKNEFHLTKTCHNSPQNQKKNILFCIWINCLILN